MTASASPRGRLTEDEQDAMQRLLDVAGRDTNQSKRIADFLLAWYNAEENGGWDPAALWSVDRQLMQDILAIIQVIARCEAYPDSLGYGEEFAQVWERWRKPASK